MTDALPPLPEPCLTGAIHRTPYYTADQMRAYAAAAVAAQWVRCDERMPLAGEEVLTAEEWQPGDWTFRVQFYSETEGGWDEGWPSHWAPLPAPPKE
jgi:hypothetical protein